MQGRSLHKAVLMGWFSVFLLLGLGVWHLQAGHLMIGIFLGLSLAAYAFYAFTFRCAGCGMPALLRPRRFLGATIYTWRCLTPETCEHCGKSLSSSPGDGPGGRQ